MSTRDHRSSNQWEMGRWDTKFFSYNNMVALIPNTGKEDIEHVWSLEAAERGNFGLSSLSTPTRKIQFSVFTFIIIS